MKRSQVVEIVARLMFLNFIKRDINEFLESHTSGVSLEVGTEEGLARAHEAIDELHTAINDLEAVENEQLELALSVYNGMSYRKFIKMFGIEGGPRF